LGEPVPLDANGRAGLSISTLSASVNPHTITTVYNGTAQFISSSGSTSHIVTAAPLTVIADDSLKVYDGQPLIGFTAHYTGFVNGEDAITAGMSGEPSFRGSAITAVEPGTYTTMPTTGTLAAANYEFTDFVSGTLTIIAADFGDAPDSYGTLLASDGPRHGLGSGLSLGASVEMDANGQPGAEASNDTGDDGVTFASVLQQGQTATVRVNASEAGARLDAFLDFNADGDFSDPGEKIFDRVPLMAGDNELRFVIPADAESATTYARFRISSAGGLSFDGLADDGEVEDYRVAVGLTVGSTRRDDGRYQLDAYNVTPGGVAVFAYGTQLGPNSLPAHGVTLGLLDPVYVAQGVADPTGHARALLTLPPALAAQTVYLQAFEQGPNPQAGGVEPLTAAALLAMPSGGAGEAPPSAIARAAGHDALDVNRDGHITPLDVLAVINFVNRQASASLARTAPVFPPPSYDTNGDGAVSPLDALNVINRLNTSGPGLGEGEADEEPLPSSVLSDRSLVGRTSSPSTPLPATGAASLAAIFSEPDLPGSRLDTILPAIVPDVWRGWSRGK
jgi:hypothetical protein